MDTMLYLVVHSSKFYLSEDKDRQIGMEQSFRVNFLEFCTSWECPQPWSTKDRPGEIGWFMFRNFMPINGGKCDTFEHLNPSKTV